MMRDPGLASMRDNSLVASMEFTIYWKDFISNLLVPPRNVKKLKQKITLSKQKLCMSYMQYIAILIVVLLFPNKVSVFQNFHNEHELFS